MNVTIALAITGTDEAPLWAASIHRNTGGNPRWRYCCEGHHHTPEAASTHGAELAAAWLSQEARALKPPTCGALALQAIG